jgi:futalosine hydrolase
MLYSRQVHHFYNLGAKLALLYGFRKKSVICTMNLLIVAATGAEIAPFTSSLKEGSNQISTLITGVGVIAATYALTKHLQSHRYDLILQAGVGGSFDRDIPLGSVVFVTSDRYGDLGAEDKDNYIDIFDMGLMDRGAFPHSDGQLITPPLVVHEWIRLPRVSGITVNTVSGHERTIQQRYKRYGCQVESMEGAAFHYVCLHEDAPFAQVRAISNYVMPRDKSQWKMKEAITNLNNWLTGFIATL